jgi:hypothetical protein
MEWLISASDQLIGQLASAVIGHLFQHNQISPLRSWTRAKISLLRSVGAQEFDN